MSKRRRKWYPCRDCRARFPRAVDLMQHRKKDHPNGKAPEKASLTTLDLDIAYLTGRIHAQLDAAAEGLGIDGSMLTERVGQLLQRGAGGSLRRVAKPV